MKTLLDNKIDYELSVIIKKFLIERTICYYNESTSELFSLSGGVPQDSILGPTLFNITMMAAVQRAELGQGQELVSYADDLTLIVSIDRTENPYRTGATIEKLVLKINRLGLLYNDKTLIVILSKKKNTIKTHLR